MAKTAKKFTKKNPYLLNLLFFKRSRCRPVVESYEIKPLMAEGQNDEDVLKLISTFKQAKYEKIPGIKKSQRIF